jgi:excisionase family DNA binding protein
MDISEKTISTIEPARLTVRIPTAMEMLGIGRSKLYELIGSGEIETIKIGKATLVIIQSLHSFVRRQRAARCGSAT